MLTFNNSQAPSRLKDRDGNPLTWRITVDWLMQNDHTFVVLMDNLKQAPFNAVVVMRDWSGWIESRVAEIALGMNVTEQERAEGYPLPKDDAERLERARVRLGAAPMTERKSDD